MLEDSLLRLQERVNKASISCGRKTEDIRIVAVSKTVSKDKIMEAFSLDLRDFGENRLQDALPKIEAMKEHDVNWHFIGSIQSRKIITILKNFEYIHSVDSLKLVKAIEEFLGESRDLNPFFFIQLNISQEETKHGFTTVEFMKSIDEILSMKRFKVNGLMTIAPYTYDEKILRKCFRELRFLAGKLEQYGLRNLKLSMGMSNDFEIAIQEGADFLRIGTALFA